jgi:hypothetical protein
MFLRLILITIIGTGCGQKSLESTTSVASIKIEQEESLSSYAKSLSIDGKTPEGVGTLLILNEGEFKLRKIDLCTWFLIDNNMALTNSHCIPVMLKNEKNISCGDILQGVFQTNRGPRIARCKKIIYSSDISQTINLNNDYALLEIENSFDDVQAFTLSRKGFEIDDKIKILTMK